MTILFDIAIVYLRHYESKVDKKKNILNVLFILDEWK